MTSFQVDMHRPSTISKKSTDSFIGIDIDRPFIKRTANILQIAAEYSNIILNICPIHKLWKKMPYSFNWF
jgi:hypothetical protein